MSWKIFVSAVCFFALTSTVFGQIQLVQNTTPIATRSAPKLPPNILGYGDGKPDGKKATGAAAK